VWSWAASLAEADARRREADELVGARVRLIRYFTLDYRRAELHPELIGRGPRVIDDEAEWAEPTWRFDGFDAMDFGLEITTDSDVAFSLTWDPPGDHEGIGLQPVAMIGSGVRRDTDVAVWEVAGRAEAWRALVGRPITGVELHYVPWDIEPGSLWCPSITVRGETGRVDIVMGDSCDGVLVPSADNVAVVHPGTSLPDWPHLDDQEGLVTA
jgi:hypothetical protein